jgi:hypothetical protein
MSVSNLTAKLAGPFAWRVTWTSDADNPTFRVFRDGILVAVTNTPQAMIAVAPGESPSIDVLDDPDDSPEPAYPAHVILNWGPSTPAAESYRVDKLAGAKWIEQGTIAPEASEQSYFEFRSGRLADDTTHTFRIVPIVNGVDGFPREHRMLMVRLPDPPTVRYTFNRLTGKVTAV